MCVVQFCFFAHSPEELRKPEKGRAPGQEARPNQDARKEQAADALREGCDTEDPASSDQVA
jgi:hypothetical protein